MHKLKQVIPTPVKHIVYKARSLQEKLLLQLKTATARINPQPILILGNQKAGTSAIAALLAAMTGKSVTIDLRKEIFHPTYCQVRQGKLTFPEFIKNNRLGFSRDIVKEPHLTTFYSDLEQHFPQSQRIFVLRDPRDNIRSILNRLNIPGNLDKLRHEDRQNIIPVWDLVMDGHWLGIEGENYIEMLAARWNFTTDVFLAHSDKMLLTRYEDFLQDKIAEIERLARSLHLPAVRDITDQVDIQFQKAGNKNVNLKEFFGAKNLACIEHLCGERMKQLGYELE